MRFHEIVGQDAVKKRLIKAASDGRVSHALIFSGPEGTGKLAMALAFAKYMNCLEPRESDACGECSSCHKFSKLIHPDLHFVFPIINSKKGSGSPICDHFLQEWRSTLLQNPYLSLNQWLEVIGDENKQAQIYSGEAGEILKKLSLKPYEGRFKIMIIWLPEKMHSSASNKLLKLIEEPPDRTLLFFVTENYEQVLLTIRSRAQTIHLPRLSENEIREYLSNSKGLEPGIAEKFSRMAQGNLAKALSLMSDHENLVKFHTRFTDFLRKSYSQNYLEMIALTDEMAEGGRERIKQLLVYGIGLLRQSFVVNLKVPEISAYADFEKDFVEKFSSRIHEKNVFAMIEELEKAHFHISRNGYPRLVLFDLGLKLTRLIRQPA